MSLSFLQIWEIISDDHLPLAQSGEESKMMDVIRSGMRLKSDNFWDSFTQICGNVDGVAELFGVTPEDISRWTKRIHELKQKVEKDDEENHPKKMMLPTGDGS